MGRIVLIAVIAVTVIHCYGALQVQMPEHAELQQPENDLQAQIRELQKNVTDIWTYIQDLRSAVSQHLIHLRQHQVELESSMHKMEHLHDATSDSHSHGDLHGDSHHHSGEQHSHGDSHDSHSHDSDSHSHGSDSHSHGSDSHSHGSDSHSHGSDSHTHSGEHHSHSGEHHSHSGEQHSHSGEHGHYSHSHSSHDHSKEDGSHSHDHGSTSSSSHSHSHDDHSHGSDHSHDHKDSHETEDLEQGIQKVATDVGPVIAEPVIAPTTRQEHYHHHHHGHSQGSRSSSGSSSNAMDLMNENTFHHHHHHHDSVSRSSRNRTVELPKYSDYDMYDFGVCNVQPNQAIPEDQRQNIQGQVTLWQKKTGGPLNIYVRLQGFQMGDHHGHHGAHQAVQQEQDNETPLEEVVHKHGFHIHALGDLSNGCQSAGPHFNPKSVNHGGPTSLVRHVGDLGNIECDSNGVANIVFSDDMASLRGQYSIIGKAMVVHAKPDDFGQGGDAESLKTGNAGTRLACCVIQQVNKLPIRYYKAMKTASQYQNY